MFEESEHPAEMAMRLFYEKNYQKAVEVFEKAFRKGEVPFWFFVLAARSNAAVGNKDAAIAHVRTAVEKGWRNLLVLEKCDELKILHNSEEWKDIVRRLGNV